MRNPVFPLTACLGLPENASPGRLAYALQIQRNGLIHEALQRVRVDLVALSDVDGASDLAVKAGV